MREAAIEGAIVDLPLANADLAAPPMLGLPLNDWVGLDTEAALALMAAISASM